MLKRFILLIVLALFCIATFAQSANVPFDIVIRNGHIIDGTGSPWYSGDIRRGFN